MKRYRAPSEPGGQWSPSDLAALVFLLLMLLWVGSCVFRGSDKPAAITPAVALSPQQPPSNTPRAAAAEQAGPVKLSDLDNAEKDIRLAINLSGNLCARPIEVREAGPNLYGVRCITNRSGYGRSNYLVNTRTNEVTKL